MKDIITRKEGCTGRATLCRPKALNALTKEMSIALEQALDAWRDDPNVELVILDAQGEKAFCAGGDIAELYERGTAGDFAFGQQFWRQEYRLNLKIAQYPKPVVSFMQGFTMGGGVGVGCHASHRIVGETSKLAMPECGIGLMPDVGGTFLLAHAPDELGVFLGLTGTQMTGWDGVNASFADHYVPEGNWEELKKNIVETGDLSSILSAASTRSTGQIEATFEGIHSCFEHDSLNDIVAAVAENPATLARSALKRLLKGAPLAMACALTAIRKAKSAPLEQALRTEFRFSYRCQSQGDFLEGIRAQIIDRDFNPRWKQVTESICSGFER